MIVGPLAVACQQSGTLVVREWAFTVHSGTNQPLAPSE